MAVSSARSAMSAFDVFGVGKIAGVDVIKLRRE